MSKQPNPYLRASEFKPVQGAHIKSISKNIKKASQKQNPLQIKGNILHFTSKVRIPCGAFTCKQVGSMLVCHMV